MCDPGYGRRLLGDRMYKLIDTLHPQDALFLFRAFLDECRLVDTPAEYRRTPIPDWCEETIVDCSGTLHSAKFHLSSTFRAVDVDIRDCSSPHEWCITQLGGVPVAPDVASSILQTRVNAVKWPGMAAFRRWTPTRTVWVCAVVAAS